MEMPLSLSFSMFPQNHLLYYSREIYLYDKYLVYLNDSILKVFEVRILSVASSKAVIRENNPLFYLKALRIFTRMQSLTSRSN